MCYAVVFLVSWCLPWYCVIQCSSGDYNLSVEWHVVYNHVCNVNVVYDCVVVMLCMTVCVVVTLCITVCVVVTVFFAYTG